MKGTTSNAFPDNALTNVSPNIVQQIVQPVHSSHAGFHAKAVMRTFGTPFQANRYKG